MKKTLAVILSCIMLLAVFVPAAGAYNSGCQYPIIKLRGNGLDIVHPEGDVVYDFTYDKSKLADDVKEVCIPHLLNGIKTGDFGDYYDALYNKLAEIYGDAKLDENGDPLGGTTIPQINIDANIQNMSRGPQATYGLYDYHFWYDWRLDPFEMADALNDYINAVLAATGKDKVCFSTICLGGTPVMAYIAKYGTSKIDALCFDSVVTNGCEKINDVFSANLTIDTEALLRYADDVPQYLQESVGDPLLFDFLYSTVKFMNSIGLSQAAIDALVGKIYTGGLGENITGIFARAGMATWPSYWSSVEPQNFEKAKEVVFGKEGGELRTKYAGLIEKIDNYYNNVTLKIPELLTNAKNDGVRLFISAKYGGQIYPYYNSCNEISDRWVSVANASFGATTCEIGKKFSDDYVAKQTAKGLGGYISVDRQIDASTCLFPDNTWFIKGLDHGDWIGSIDQIVYGVCCGNITDIHSDPRYPQFLFGSVSPDAVVPLSEENMNCENYYGTDTGSTEDLTFIQRLVKRFFAFLDMIMNALSFLLK